VIAMIETPTHYPDRALISWSGGKDCNFALYETLAANKTKVDALVATAIEGSHRLSAHGVHLSLIESQAHAIGIPLELVWVPKNPSNPVYEAATLAHWRAHHDAGIRHVIYGDLVLQDIRDYRDALLKRGQMTGLYPLWLRDTKGLARAFIDAGLKAILVCVDTTRLDASFSGRAYDEQLLADLPDHIDPCGENGEFHTYVWNGPHFQSPVKFDKVNIIRDEKYAFCDLVLKA
jgi:uncharacterized protein (TIGR00290 family)